MTTKLLSSNQPETINPAYCLDLHPAKSLGFRIPSNIPNAPSHCADAPSYPGRGQGEARRSIDSHRPHLGVGGEGGIGPSAPAFTNAHRRYALPCHQRHDLPRKMAIHRGYALALATCYWRKTYPNLTSWHPVLPRWHNAGGSILSGARRSDADMQKTEAFLRTAPSNCNGMWHTNCRSNNDWRCGETSDTNRNNIKYRSKTARCAGRAPLGNGSIGFTTVSIHQPVPNINPIQRCRALYPRRSQGRYETWD